MQLIFGIALKFGLATGSALALASLLADLEGPLPRGKGGLAESASGADDLVVAIAGTAVLLTAKGISGTKDKARGLAGGWLAFWSGAEVDGRVGRGRRRGGGEEGRLSPTCGERLAFTVAGGGLYAAPVGRRH